MPPENPGESRPSLPQTGAGIVSRAIAPRRPLFPPPMNPASSLRHLLLACIPLVLVCSTIAGADAAPATTTRLVVLTDIEADPDDTESLVRLLLYSNEIDLEGLIATTSTWKKSSLAPDSIRAVIRTYGRVHANLLLHDRRYPSADALAALVKSGRPEYGLSGVGPGKDTEGSAWIVRCLEKNDDRPLWISVWGGANTLAQALQMLQATRSAEEVDRLVAKLRVYTISDQDDSGPWIRRTFPKLFYIVSPGGDYSQATWSAINSVIPGIDNATIGNRWLAEHIQQGHGPLGAAYPDVSWGMEGDTPSWLGLIPNGLGDPEHPDWGGWGGRYELRLPDASPATPQAFVNGVALPPETRPIWTNAIDTYAPPAYADHGRPVQPGQTSFQDAKVTLWRWRDDFQNDFAARMTWTTRPFAEANHPPVLVLDTPDRITVKAGAGFGISARGTTDPDGDSLSCHWFVYPEAGSHRGPMKIDGADNSDGIWLTAPAVQQPETVHVILRVTDKGTPALSRYKRVIVTVTP